MRRDLFRDFIPSDKKLFPSLFSFYLYNFNDFGKNITEVIKRERQGKPAFQR